jgi:two-component system NarL family sensor kinase
MSVQRNVIITPESHLAFERSIEMLDNSLRDIRQVAMQMIPELLMNEGLHAALKDYCAHVPHPEGLQINYESVGLDGPEMEREKAVAVYGIVQELLKNTIQHASAGKVTILVTNREGKVTVTVEDDGKGFDPVVLRGGRGVGWSMILEKTAQLGAQVNTRSAPGAGTMVRLEVPLDGLRDV